MRGRRAAWGVLKARGALAHTQQRSAVPSRESWLLLPAPLFTTTSSRAHTAFLHRPLLLQTSHAALFRICRLPWCYPRQQRNNHVCRLTPPRRPDVISACCWRTHHRTRLPPALYNQRLPLAGPAKPPPLPSVHCPPVHGTPAFHIRESRHVRHQLPASFAPSHRAPSLVLRRPGFRRPVRSPAQRPEPEQQWQLQCELPRTHNVCRCTGKPPSPVADHPRAFRLAQSAFPLQHHEKPGRERIVGYFGLFQRESVR